MRLTAFQVYDNATSEPVKTPKSYGYALKTSELPDGFAKFFPLALSGPAAANGLPCHLLLSVLSGIRNDIVTLRKAFEQVHLRMVGGSVLILYEADWEQSEKGLKAHEAEREKREARVRGGVEDEDEDEDESDDESDEEDHDSDEDEDDEPGPPFVVKLIDFAHTRIIPGQGPDQGVLLGLDTIIRLLDGRIEQVRNAGCGSITVFPDQQG